MKYIYRKMLLVLAVATFLVVAPAVVLYSVGYRFSLLEESPLAVGVLIVETIPENVNLDVNDVYVGRTPRSVPNLLPGSVKVKLSETGYVDWQKNLPIYSAMATDLSGVRLFPSKPTSTVLATSVDSFMLSPNRNLIAITENNNRIRIIDYKGEVIMNPRTLPGTPTQMIWSTDSSMLVIKYEDSSFSILDAARPDNNLQLVTDIQQTEQLVWDQRRPGRLLVRTKDNRLLAYSTASKETEVLVNNVANFSVGSRHIYLVDDKENLKVYSLDGRLIRTLPTELTSKVKSLLVTPAEDVAIHFVDGNLSLLGSDDELESISDGVITAGWSLDGQMLHVQTSNNELYVKNVSNERILHLPVGKMQLVTRLSRSVTHPQWYAGGHHLIYQADDEVFITEIDTRDHSISYLVADTGLKNSMSTVGEEGNVIYYLKKLENGRTNLMETSLIAN